MRSSRRQRQQRVEIGEAPLARLADGDGLYRAAFDLRFTFEHDQSARVHRLGQDGDSSQSANFFFRQIGRQIEPGIFAGDLIYVFRASDEYRAG